MSIDFSISDGICLLGGTEKECTNDCTVCKLAADFLNGDNKDK